MICFDHEEGLEEIVANLLRCRTIQLQYRPIDRKVEFNASTLCGCECGCLVSIWLSTGVFPHLARYSIQQQAPSGIRPAVGTMFLFVCYYERVRILLYGGL